jgi:exodeoxyribonuclease V alpha subunit
MTTLDALPGTDFPGISTPGWVDRARPFVAAGLLAADDVYVVDRFVDLVVRRADAGANATWDVDVLLALALAVRAPREGSAGVDLRTIADAVGDRAIAAGGSFPAPADWIERVRAAATLVATNPDDTRPFVHDGALLAMRRYAVYQRDLATTLLERRSAPAVVVSARSARACEAALDRAFGVVATGGSDILVDHQRRAAEACLVSGLVLLSGGPGTGKTYTLRRVLVVLRALFRAETGRDPLVALAAPTGKAAVRMADLVHVAAAPFDPTEDPDQAAELAFLRSLQPSTIHRLLHLGRGPTTRATATRARPLPHDLVIVDEASMIDLAMMARLTAAIRPGARLVLVGDPQQLASVEAGSVLADVISPEATALAGSVVRLTRSRRVAAASPLAELGTYLAEGTAEAFDAATALFRGAPGGELQNYPHTDNTLSTHAESLATAHHRDLVDWVTRQAVGEHVATAREALARIDRFRLLTPHRRGRLGVAGLSATLVARLARERPEHVGVDARAQFFPGLPLMVLENRPELGLVNGDVGVVVRDETGRLVVAFGGTDDGAPRFYRRAELPAHEPCLAMTVHKSQGSQYRSVLFVLPNEPSPILTRELVYTAVTRAEQQVVLAGSTTLFRRALDRRITRASSLALSLTAPPLRLLPFPPPPTAPATPR